MRRHGRSQRKSLKLANRRLDRLSSTIDDLFEKAIQNEKILGRYQQFELRLLGTAGFEALLDMLIRNSIEYFNLDSVQLWLYDPQSTLLEHLPECFTDNPSLGLMTDSHPFTTLYGSQPTVKLLSVNDDSVLPVFHGQGLRSAALLPLVRHGVIVGSLHFGVKTPHRFTDDKSTEFIEHLASVVSVCLENAVNQDRLHRLSMFDMLTQVKNRRAFHQALDEEVSRAARSGDSISLLFVDLDHFKRINDRYGHPMGDRVLRDVAGHINTMLRKTDHVCRYGGEEFALVLPNCGRQRAMDIAERIREQISELLISDDKSVCVRVTLSIGVCGWYGIATESDTGVGNEQKIAQELINSSDKAVYLAKAAGRNCIYYVQLDSNQFRSRGREGKIYESFDDKLDAVMGRRTNSDSRRNDVWPEMTL